MKIASWLAVILLIAVLFSGSLSPWMAVGLLVVMMLIISFFVMKS